MQEVLLRQRVKKTNTTPLHQQSDGMIDRFIRTVKEHRRKVVTSCRAFNYDPVDVIPVSLVFRRVLRLPRDLLFGALPYKEQRKVDYNIHSYAVHHLKLTRDWMKTRHDRLATCAVYHEGIKV
jgi:hypothetical protein